MLYSSLAKYSDLTLLYVSRKFRLSDVSIWRLILISFSHIFKTDLELFTAFMLNITVASLISFIICNNSMQIKHTMD
jgi:hypothetical protein